MPLCVGGNAHLDVSDDGCVRGHEGGWRSRRHLAFVGDAPSRRQHCVDKNEKTKKNVDEKSGGGGRA